MSGLFITFEGQECAGKSTQVSLLKEWLESQKRQVYCTREPGGTALSESIRTLLLNHSDEGVDARAELLLFTASRAQLMAQKILPFLQQDGVVICDRFYDSTTAYQGYARGLDLQVIRQLNDFCTCGRRPDLTFVLDLTVAESRRRLALRSPGAADRMESEADTFFEKVRNGFLAIAQAEPNRVKVLDASLPVQELQTRIRQQIQAISTL